MERIPFIYTVNDDLFIKNILSGAYLGTPDGHVVYMEYPLSYLIQSLYQWNGGIPWYGICLLLFQIVAWLSVAYRLLQMGKNKSGRIGKALLLGAVFMATGFYHMASMQYTITAAILGMAALVWFYTCDFDMCTKDVLKDNIITMILVVFSFCVRRNVLFMLLPFAGMIWLRKWLIYKKIQKFGGIVVMVAIGVAAVSGISYYAYSSSDWQYYKTYNDNATILYDYYGWPEYEENIELYEELGISYEAYYGAKNHYLLSLDKSIDADAMVTLAERSKEIHETDYATSARLMVAFKDTVLRITKDIDRPLNLIVFSLYAISILLAFLQKKKEVFVSLLFLIIGRMFAWLYILYEGRYPTRITQSLFFAECGILLAVLLTELWTDKWTAKERGWKKVLLIATGIGYLVLLGGLSVIRVRHVKAENIVRLEASQDLFDLKEYCGERLKNFYLVDSKSITGDTELIFDKKGSRFENYIVFGGWLSGSPVYNDKMKQAGIENVEDALLNRENVFTIFKNTEECETTYLLDYFESKYKGFSYQVVEQFGRNNNQFKVYKFRVD